MADFLEISPNCSVCFLRVRVRHKSPLNIRSCPTVEVCSAAGAEVQEVCGERLMFGLSGPSKSADDVISAAASSVRFM